MNIITQDIHSITFDDIVAFCKQGIIEGVQLEYKMDFPKDLAKQFVTFSNTQGGLIIIGVEEDPKTGLPKSWPGLASTGKHIDRVHQLAANVLPLPNYDVVTTNDDKGKLFVLIRIYEGLAPPYATQNDPTPWVRTGNISTPLRAANREELLQLLSKKEQAQSVRDASCIFAKDYFDIELTDAEEQRKALIQKGEKVYTHVLGGNNAALLSVYIQPFYPSSPLLKVQDLLARLHEYCGDDYGHTAFQLKEATTLPGGISSLHWSHDVGLILAQQIYANGLIFSVNDVLRSSEDGRKIYLYSIGYELYAQLKVAQRLYNKVGYHGLLKLKVELKGGKGATVDNIVNTGMSWRTCSSIVKLPEYKWHKDLDTNSIATDTAMLDVLAELLQEVGWGLGLGEVPMERIEQFFVDNQWAKAKTPESK